MYRTYRIRGDGISKFSGRVRLMQEAGVGEFGVMCHLVEPMDKYWNECVRRARQSKCVRSPWGVHAVCKTSKWHGKPRWQELTDRMAAEETGSGGRSGSVVVVGAK